MDAARFDTIAKRFAERRLTRRQALAQGSAGLASAGAVALGVATAASAQDATPAPAADAERGPVMLFVQSFQSGSVAAKEGADGRYTVTLEQGLGQTIYFSDRPHRIVGAAPTPQFLAGLGFFADNPPNAALVVESAGGKTDIAVVELFAPVYDEASHTATYEVAVLADWEASTELGFTQAPADLASVAPTFGAAHLFIDGCAERDVECWSANPEGGESRRGVIPSRDFGGWCWSLDSLFTCVPCEGPSHWGSANDRFAEICNQRFVECNNACYQKGF